MRDFRRPISGFSLVELLVAIALFSSLGALLVQLVRGSFELYRQGDRQGDLYAAAMPALELLERDLVTVDSGRDGRLMALPTALGKAGEGLLLRLIRSIPGGEAQHAVLRQAGTTAEPTGIFTGDDPGPEERRAVIPPGGLMEVAYALLQDPRDPVGVLTLYRGERSYEGPGTGFFSEAAAAADEAWVRAHLRPVASGILGMWVLFLGQTSEGFSETEVLAGLEAGPDVGFTAWDSTRGELSVSQFPLARGPASRNDPRDDVYPRAVRIVLHVARNIEGDARVRRGMTDEDAVLDVNTTDAFPVDDTEDAFIKVGSEWMIARTKSSGTASVRRGALKSDVTLGVVPTGTPVFVGKMFRKTFRIPTSRSFWGESR